MKHDLWYCYNVRLALLPKIINYLMSLPLDSDKILKHQTPKKLWIKTFSTVTLDNLNGPFQNAILKLSVILTFFDFCELRITFSEVGSLVSISVWVNNEKRYIVDQCHKMKITQKRRGCYLLRLVVAAHVILCFRKRHYTKT